MYTEKIEYNDEFCCSDIKKTASFELVDSYGGDYTYRDTYVCKKCNRVFYEYYGNGRFEGIREEI